MEFFDQLGTLIQRRWRARDFEPGAFAEIAAAALRKLPPCDHTTYRDVVDAFVFDDALPVQPPDPRFGQPQIVVHEAPDFYIEVLCWVDATTAIHQHSFAGAFCVLEGSSLHTTYGFTPQRTLGSTLEIGALRFLASERLRAGDVRTIAPGRAFIHALFHLDRPSISVVVRTRRQADLGPQWSYLPPALALDQRAEEQHPTRARVAQLLTALGATDPAGYDRLIARAIAESDLATVWLAARHAHGAARKAPYRRSEAWLDAVLGAAAVRFGGSAGPLLATLDGAARAEDLMLRRADVHDPDLRFFLALLLNVPTRAELLDLVAAHAPGDPRATVMRWIRALTTARAPNHAVLLELELELDAPIDDMRVADLLHATIEGMLDGHTGDALAARVASVSGALPALRDAIADLAARLRTGSLAPLFVD
ncbi:hypothetical protein WME76_45550 (plasmid) [Sorangium sp. So ce119]|uniref:hypothetical protein n=1 Tax=Sorangium sp. So ce119 TaxID=3133279 RepID=UPI003F5E3CBC